MEEKKAELVFIPLPGMGHLIPCIQLAKKLIDRNGKLTITILVMKFSSDDKVVTSYIDSLESDPSINKGRMTFIDLPHPEQPTGASFTLLAESYKPIVRGVLWKRVKKSACSPADYPPSRVAGVVIDMLNTAMIDVANEVGLPSYVFFTSGASFLSLMMHVLSLVDDQGVDVVAEFNKPDFEVNVPGLRNLLPGKVIPSRLQEKDGCEDLLKHGRRYRQAKGILINSFTELESHALEALNTAGKIPCVYPVGPIVTVNQKQDRATKTEEKDLMGWLDHQPPSSVVFLCFGSRGSFNEDQAKEIATGLEKSGHRFLWSLRRPGKMGEMAPPVDYDLEKLNNVLPVGFLERTAEIGKVIGWAPQIDILGHPSVGAFVSHCGWNSTLESLWFGVPIAAWPLYAEQQMNAFGLVKEFGLAAEIRMDYKWDVKNQSSNLKVNAEEVEAAVNKVITDEVLKEKVKAIQEQSRVVLNEGGSSYNSIGRFIEDVFNNIP